MSAVWPCFPCPQWGCQKLLASKVWLLAAGQYPTSSKEGSNQVESCQATAIILAASCRLQNWRSPPVHLHLHFHLTLSLSLKVTLTSC